MTHASVFSGIGGPEVAATMLGWDNLFHCEINPFGRQVLDYWYPNAESYDDITTTDFSKWRGRVDVLTGGFPCQPFSYAGRRRGAEDDRYLWPSMYRAIDEIQPTWVVAENVAGILTMVEQGEVSKVAGSATLFDAFDDLRGRYELRETFTLQRICTDLESHGYAVQPVLVPACAVGAPHRRDRVFIVARRKDEGFTTDTDDNGLQHDAERGKQAGVFGTTGERGQDSLSEQIQCAAATCKRECSTNAEDAPDTNGLGWREGRCKESQRQNDRDPLAIFGNAERLGKERTSADTSCECGQRLRPGQSETRGTSQEQSGGRGGEDGCGRTSSDTIGGRISGCSDNGEQCDERHHGQHQPSGQPFGIRHQQGWVFDGWCDSDCAGLQRWQNFPSVSPVHRGNDGLPFDVDRLTLSFGKWRTEALKAYGNAIVPQVMYEIFRAIEQVENP